MFDTIHIFRTIDAQVRLRSGQYLNSKTVLECPQLLE